MLAVSDMLISENRAFCGLVVVSGGEVLTPCGLSRPPPRAVLSRVETYCSSRNRMWILTVLDLQ